MTKKISSEELVKNVAKCRVITESEINLLKSRLNRGEKIDFSKLDNKNIYVTEEQSIKGLNYLRNHFLTSKNARRKKCIWSRRELQVIGFDDDYKPLRNVKTKKLFKLLGFENIGNAYYDIYVPIYEIGYVAYFMVHNEPMPFTLKIFFNHKFICH